MHSQPRKTVSHGGTENTENCSFSLHLALGTNRLHIWTARTQDSAAAAAARWRSACREIGSWMAVTHPADRLAPERFSLAFLLGLPIVNPHGLDLRRGLRALCGRDYSRKSLEAGATWAAPLPRPSGRTPIPSLRRH